MPPPPLSRLACCLLSALFVAQGCAHRPVLVPDRPPPLTEEARAQLGTVGLVPARFSPDVYVERYPGGPGSGTGGKTAEGAVAGASVGVTGAAALLPLGLIFPPVLIAAGAVLVVFTVGGAAMGVNHEAATSDPAESTAAAEAAFHAVAHPKIQLDLQSHVFRLGQELPSADLLRLDGLGPTSVRDPIDLGPFAGSGLDTLLVVQVEALTLTVLEGEPPLFAVDMAVRAIAARTADGARLDERLFTCRAGKRPLREWSTTGARPFDGAVARCHERVAERLLEELFLVYPPPPEPGWSFGGNDFARAEVSSLHPTLAWGTFPAAGGRHTRPESVLSRVRDVTYELRVWRREDGFPGELVYRRTGLPAPAHTVEQALDPSAHYFWSVRARFRLDGRTRVTPWAVTRERTAYAPDTLDRATHDFYYRFTTPVAGTAAPALD